MSITSRDIIRVALMLAGVLFLATGCEDSTSAAGGSLIQDRVEIIMDSTYTVSGRSVAYNQVQSRTTMQLLGRLNADGFGQISSDIVTQYMPAAALDTAYTKASYIDSVKMVLAVYQTGFTGDSLAPMGLNVYPLKRQLPSPIYSSFDPADYVDRSNLLGSTAFSATIDGAENVEADDQGNIYKNVVVDLPKSVGENLFKQYLESPSTFDTPSSFASWFPGLYITTSFGSGRITRIDNNVIQVYYHKVVPKEVTGAATDSIIKATGNYMGVTPEIISNNNISYSMSSKLGDRVRKGETLLVAPLGYDVEFSFPAREIVADYKAKAGNLAVVNSLTMSIPAEEIINDFSITPPPYILMVKKSKKDEFFDKIQVNDNISSFYATYNSVTHSYDFSSMRDYILELIAADEIKNEDTDFVITPVLVAFYENESSSSYYYYYYSAPQTQRIVAKITPYVSQPVMVNLRLDKAKIKFTFSKQSVKF